MDYIESNIHKWYKAQGYKWQGDIISAEKSGSYKEKNAFFEYDPFITQAALYKDFYLLMRKVEEYRSAFSDLGSAHAKSRADGIILMEDPEFQNHLRLQSEIAEAGGQISQGPFMLPDRNIGKKRKIYGDMKKKLMQQYIEFSNRWGMLGVGFSRIVNVSNSGLRDSIIHEQGKVKKLILNEADTTFDIDLIEQSNTKLRKYSRFQILLPDNLQVSGEPVALSTWMKDYASMKFRSYSESVNSLAGCRELLWMLNDINNPENYIDITLQMSVVISSNRNTSWRFNSLIQAILMIHILNKSRLRSATTKLKTKIKPTAKVPAITEATDLINGLLPEQQYLPWGICCECKQIFSIKNYHQRKYCSETCCNTVAMRSYRKKRKIIET